MKTSFVKISVLAIILTLTSACSDGSQGVLNSALSNSSASQFFVQSIYSSTLCENIGGKLWCSEGGDVVFAPFWGGISAPGVAVPFAGFSSSVTSAAFGGDHICAIVDSGAVQCWGFGIGLGNGTLDTNYGSASSVSLPASALSITSGWYHSCVSLTDGSVECWGYGGDGELGNASSSVEATPVSVLDLDAEGPLTNVSQVAAQGLTTCALQNNGHVKCWGYNVDGELGNNDSSTSSIPVAVDVLTTFSSSSIASLDSVVSLCSGWDYSCVLTANSGVKCWGSDNFGAVGDNNSSSNTYLATDVVDGSSSAISSVSAISCGIGHACALMNDGSMDCWGDNVEGELGDGTTTNRAYAAPVTILDGPVSIISAGFDRTCAVTSDLKTRCWGGEVLPDGSSASSAYPIAAFSSSGTAAGLTMAPLGPTITNECFPIGIYTVNSTGELSEPVSSAVSVIIGQASSRGVYFSDSGCSSSTSSATIEAGANSTVVYFGDASSESVGMVAVDASSSLSSSGFETMSIIMPIPPI